MKKSYEKLVKQIGAVTEENAVAAAVDKLRRHSSRNVICLRCENDHESCFQVTDVDNVTGSITEVKCERCKDTSHVCRRQCLCQRSPSSTNILESSYKEKLGNRTVQHNRKSIHICSVMESTAALLRRSNSGNGVCSCSINDWEQFKVLGVDRLGFITSVQCSSCQNIPALSPFEESYVVQKLYHEQPNRDAVIQKALDGDHVQHIDEICSLLLRHSFYADSICPEFDTRGDRECCRVTATRESGEVTEVEFDIQGRKVQRLQITCHDGCYYGQYGSPTKYELTYKEKMREHLEPAASGDKRRERIDESRELSEAVLSCTVLAATATVLRRHNIDNKLCQKCQNDDNDFLEVTEVDKHGFIKRVRCGKCRQSMSTECSRARIYYEEIDESVRLERGDHISWHRSLAYWHHGIVTQADDRRFTIAHYGSRGCSVILRESTKLRRDMSTSLCSGTVHRITYDDCYTNEYAALRAEKLLGEKRYNPFNRNCELSSHQCKTGLVKSDQLSSFYSSIYRTLLAFCLRLLNVILLWVFQIIHEKRQKTQIDRKAFEHFEHIITGAYMLVVFLLFLTWSMYTEWNKLKPTTASNHCCRRHPRVACGLSARIIVRELFAASGPFVLLWFEDGILPHEGLWKRQLAVFFTLLAVTVVSYMLGAVIGTLVEYSKYCICNFCISCCDASSDQTEQTADEQTQLELQAPTERTDGET